MFFMVATLVTNIKDMGPKSMSDMLQQIIMLRIGGKHTSWQCVGARKSYHDTRSCRCNEEGIETIKVGGRESCYNILLDPIAYFV